MTGPRGHRAGELDTEASAALQALRAAEDMPAAAQARVWARLAAATAEPETGPKEHVPTGMSNWAWGAVVLAAAAALLLASRAGVLGPLVAGRGGEAASYVERSGTASETAVRRRSDMSGGTGSAPVGPEPAGAGDPSNMVVETGPEVQPRGRGDSGQGADGKAPREARAKGAADAARADAGGPREARAKGAADEPRTDAGAPREARAKGAAEGAGEGVAASSLAQEAEALARAQAAIQGGRAEEALQVLADYARRFPGGALREEHDALRALALCAAGRRIEGRGEARAFLSARGGSALAERVRRGCLDE